MSQKRGASPPEGCITVHANQYELDTLKSEEGTPLISEITMSDKYVRTAIVTGATSCIGKATVRKCIAAGFGLGGNGRNATKMAELKKETVRNSVVLFAMLPTITFWKNFFPCRMMLWRNS